MRSQPASTAAPTTVEIAVRSPMSAAAEVSTTTRWNAVRSERLGRPVEPASAPGTSGTGMGSSTSGDVMVAGPSRARGTGAPSYRR